MHAQNDGAIAGTELPTTTISNGAAAVPNPSSLDAVGAFLQALHRREVCDEELRAHAIDCSRLMEEAHARFLAYQDPADREHAVLWMHRRDEALRSLSPAWKAAREAEIQRAIAAHRGAA